MQTLAAAVRDLTDTLRAENDGALSPAEARIAARLRRAEKCILERDAEITAGDLTISCTLRAYGRFHRAHPGQSGGRGERRVSPPEEAHFEVDRVTLGSIDGEDEIYDCLSSNDIDAIAAAAYEDAEE